MTGIPVRLSEALTVRARAEAEQMDRSLTEQVEHWARLGQVVETAIQAATVQRLKTRSHDPELAERLAFAKTPAGQAKAAALIRDRNAVRHGVSDSGTIEKVARTQKRTKR